ncbi:transcriptional regulator NrdR [Candidatus Daviesbacteria bacterium RIFCSPLOWO2_01_FULL_38_10]|uniref:Transcriptional repressor NrdR n=1 Tax=Candidatus Daviesbacteria bacterium GW2011_GWF2_38_6 TaxID=1618432 RepID=A0A0G0MV80_9BACT|nr:MAG: Transcriptional repressor NrdR [Candidatus Daviesbacteria bacterium GW2011_GWA2_38_17]KKQ77564.1 MAG: Transcriptional repressor NrdR [Candidatus Daviesbacteria bacterium GW2011_GWF2_38_6]OGE26246.1 MAG: transcriptional regulator NrdR [Candidatus Daviesbacteria bacterium RIFCSPHIGHO2_02_FULL_39_41]OGE37209.1 MAG: transcriptional regulator NrdR [Candidatus Daviesbacteria bacterium RIFCSPLOWO2_01_FULL_38_10]OGE44966.1 MAG: transcriptional regulator NrdR [Candidatus Daviesbacteria bacterium
MKCPFCQSFLSKVVDKRSVDSRGEIRRRRECLKCGKRFTTYEIISAIEILVIKKDGKKEPFAREKLQVGLSRALEKRPGLEKVARILDKIEGRIRAKRIQEVPSQTLGKWVLSELKKLDPVAYLRFASVYRTFSDTKDFKKELETL